MNFMLEWKVGNRACFKKKMLEKELDVQIVKGEKWHVTVEEGLEIWEEADMYACKRHNFAARSGCIASVRGSCSCLTRNHHQPLALS